MEYNPELSSGENQPKKSTKAPKDYTALFIGIMVLLLGVLVYLYYAKTSVEEENALQKEEIDRAMLQLDSLSNQLDQKILTISQLGGEIDTLVKLRDELEEQKKQLILEKDSQKRIVANLKDKVGGYEELLRVKDSEILKLKQLNEQLVAENTELKSNTENLSKSIQEINQAKDELAEKVALAGRLKVENLKVFAVNDRGREREEEFKNRQIDKLKITFTVLENEVAPIEGKELYIRIVDPNGDVLFDMARGSGSFIYEGRDMFYSAKHEILYDKNKQKVELNYQNGEEYADGRHKVQVYTEDYLMGEGSFRIKD